MTNLTLEEMELSILINGTDRHTAEVFTDDAVWVERLQRAGFTPYQVRGVSHFYKIPVNKIVCIRSAEDKPISPARLAALERARNAKFGTSNSVATEDSLPVAA